MTTETTSGGRTEDGMHEARLVTKVSSLALCSIRVENTRPLQRLSVLSLPSGRWASCMLKTLPNQPLQPL